MVSPAADEVLVSAEQVITPIVNAQNTEAQRRVDAQKAESQRQKNLQHGKVMDGMLSNILRASGIEPPPHRDGSTRTISRKQLIVLAYGHHFEDRNSSKFAEVLQVAKSLSPTEKKEFAQLESVIAGYNDSHPGELKTIIGHIEQAHPIDIDSAALMSNSGTIENYAAPFEQQHWYDFRSQLIGQRVEAPDHNTAAASSPAATKGAPDADPPPKGSSDPAAPKHTHQPHAGGHNSGRTHRNTNGMRAAQARDAVSPPAFDGDKLAATGYYADGQPTIGTSDAMNKQIDQLIAKVKASQGTGQVITSISVVGVASYDGNFETNKKLAEARGADLEALVDARLKKAGLTGVAVHHTSHVADKGQVGSQYRYATATADQPVASAANTTAPTAPVADVPAAPPVVPPAPHLDGQDSTSAGLIRRGGSGVAHDVGHVVGGAVNLPFDVLKVGVGILAAPVEAVAHAVRGDHPSTNGAATESQSASNGQAGSQAYAASTADAQTPQGQPSADQAAPPAVKQQPRAGQGTGNIQFTPLTMGEFDRTVQQATAKGTDISLQYGAWINAGQLNESTRQQIHQTFETRARADGFKGQVFDNIQDPGNHEKFEVPFIRTRPTMRVGPGFGMSSTG